MLCGAESLSQQFFHWSQGAVWTPEPTYMYMDVPTLPVPRVKIFPLHSSFSALKCFFWDLPKVKSFSPQKSAYEANKVIFPHWDQAHLQPDHPLTAWRGRTRDDTPYVGAYLGSDLLFSPSIRTKNCSAAFFNSSSDIPSSSLRPSPWPPTPCIAPRSRASHATLQMWLHG